MVVRTRKSTRNCSQVLYFSISFSCFPSQQNLASIYSFALKKVFLLCFTSFIVVLCFIVKPGLQNKSQISQSMSQRKYVSSNQFIMKTVLSSEVYIHSFKYLIVVVIYIRAIRVLGSQPQYVIASSNTTSTNSHKQWNQLQKHKIQRPYWLRLSAEQENL